MTPERTNTSQKKKNNNARTVPREEYGGDLILEEYRYYQQDFTSRRKWFIFLKSTLESQNKGKFYIYIYLILYHIFYQLYTYLLPISWISDTRLWRFPFKSKKYMYNSAYSLGKIENDPNVPFMLTINIF